MRQLVVVLVGALLACAAGCRSGASGGSSGASGGAGGSNLIQATYPACEAQGQALATYLASGNPPSNDLNWGDQRQQELSLSGVQQSLYISQIADQYISTCDTNDTQAAQQAQQQASASAPASAAAAQQAAVQADVGVECAKLGGEMISNDTTCASVPYYGSDDSTYYDSLEVQGTALAPDITGGVGTTATKSECEDGYYPDASAGPVHAAPGHWGYDLCLVN